MIACTMQGHSIAVVMMMVCTAIATMSHAEAFGSSMSTGTRMLWAPQMKLRHQKRQNSAFGMEPVSGKQMQRRTISPLHMANTESEEEAAKSVALQSLQDDLKQRVVLDESEIPSLLVPYAKKLDELTGGWALQYADLSPATETSPQGVAFLATNAAYAWVGLILGIQGEFLLGGLVELAGAVSFWYHWSQLKYGTNRMEVRLALLTDYLTAGAALITGVLYCFTMGIQTLPLDVVLTGAAAIFCLGLSWVWEFGMPYLFWHSLWHIFSAMTGYLVGQAHLTTYPPMS
jgi:hypothetical protein|uniref:Uncharacterized protein n=1 Tax=Attheya septentrionalis TaxID=420275 RepID=A0A7S2UKF8_9STRA|mmetsp:Transcript_26104/g.47355  ORF Transcript_26104/g.47355 Transcript_26104/m.47355 type:complete len:288 (+) Transcript_26104:209-1072(+)